ALQGFTRLLKEAGYIQGQTVSIDGTKIRANASLSVDIDSIYKRIEDIDLQLSTYLQELEQADSAEQELELLEAKKTVLQTQIVALQQELELLSAQKNQMEEQGLKRLNLTDKNARIMKSRNGKHFCYNVQVAVDAHQHLIICSDTTSQENDKGLLTPMVEQTTATIGTQPQEVLADAGYYVLSQIENLEQERNVNCFVAINTNKQQQVEAAGIGFKYHEDKDAYECSQGQWLFPKYGIKKDTRRGTQAQLYQGATCTDCVIRKQCTDSSARSIHRFSNQSWRDAYIEKMRSQQGKTKLRQRKALSEHPFGTIKYWMGQIPLLLRGKINVQTEINLYVMAYNFKRLTQIARFDEIQQLIKRFNW
ncbi:transposase, partial [Solitalea sp. MAHUQ-68]